MESAGPQPEQRDASGQKQVVLVVDARPLRQFYTSIFLQRLNYQVIMAKTAEDAVLFLGLTVPLVIIANYDLPQMTGLELLLHERRDNRTRGVPFIIYTSNRSPDLQQICEQAGCSAFLRHPCSLEDLYATIEATQKRPRRFLRLETALDVVVGGRSSENGKAGTRGMLPHGHGQYHANSDRSVRHVFVRFGDDSGGFLSETDGSQTLRQTNRKIGGRQPDTITDHDPAGTAEFWRISYGHCE